MVLGSRFNARYFANLFSSASIIPITFFIFSVFLISLISATLLSSSVFASSETTDTVTVKVPVSCTMSATGMNNHNATIQNGIYTPNIGTTTIKTSCNDANGFSLYAISYSNDTYGNTNLLGANTGETIATGTATSGNASNWAMKLATSSTATYPISILSDTNGSFTNYHTVPTTYTKVATRTAATDAGTSVIGSELTTTYSAFVSATQRADTYTGKVKYTLVHPHDALAPGYAYLDTGETINKKLKSLANGTVVTDPFTDDHQIKAFVRSATLPANFTPSSANTISLDTSPAPVYV